MASRPATVIFVNRFYRPDQSATAQVLSNLAEHLVTRDYAVEVVTSRLSSEGGYSNQLSPYEVIDGVKIYRVLTTSIGEKAIVGRAIDYMSFYVSAAYRLWHVVRKDDIVVAKTDPPMLCVLVYLIVRLKRAKQVNWIQDLFPEVAHGLGIRVPLVSRLLRWPRNLVFRRSTANVAIGKQMQQRVISITNDSPPTEIIENWVVAPNVKPVSTEENSLHREWCLEGKFVVGYSGNLGRAHDVNTIVAAIEKLKDRPDITFLFVGNGPAHRAIASANYPNVIVRPYQAQDRLSECLSCADAHLVSLYPAMEGLIVPSKLYGVLAVGKPIVYIGSDRGEIGSLVQLRSMGEVVAIGDAAALIDVIVRLATKPALLRSYAANALTYYESFCAYGISHRKWESLIARLERSAPNRLSE